MKMKISAQENNRGIKLFSSRMEKKKNTGLNCFSPSSKLSMKIKSGDEKNTLWYSQKFHSQLQILHYLLVDIISRAYSSFPLNEIFLRINKVLQNFYTKFDTLFQFKMVPSFSSKLLKDASW